MSDRVNSNLGSTFLFNEVRVYAAYSQNYSDGLMYRNLSGSKPSVLDALYPEYSDLSNIGADQTASSMINNTFIQTYGISD